MNKNLLSSLKGPWLRKGIAVLVFGMAVFNIAVTIKPSSSGNSFPNLSLSSISAYATARDGDTDPPGGGGGASDGWLWQSQYVPCSVTTTTIILGHVTTVTETGVKKLCVDGLNLCFTGSCVIE